MQFNVPIFPEQASDFAKHVDAFYLFLVLITTFFSLLIAMLILFFIIKYRKSPEREAEQIHGSTLLEIVWTAIPLGISMVIFVWGAILYFHLQRPPADAMEIYGVASSGCGNSSIRAASARSTPCMFPRGAQSRSR